MYNQSSGTKRGTDYHPSGLGERTQDTNTDGRLAWSRHSELSKKYTCGTEAPHVAHGLSSQSGEGNSALESNVPQLINKHYITSLGFGSSCCPLELRFVFKAVYAWP